MKTIQLIASPTLEGPCVPSLWRASCGALLPPYVWPLHHTAITACARRWMGVGGGAAARRKIEGESEGTSELEKERGREGNRTREGRETVERGGEEEGIGCSAVRLREEREGSRESKLWKGGGRQQRGYRRGKRVLQRLRRTWALVLVSPARGNIVEGTGGSFASMAYILEDASISSSMRTRSLSSRRAFACCQGVRVTPPCWSAPSMGLLGEEPR